MLLRGKPPRSAWMAPHEGQIEPLTETLVRAITATAATGVVGARTLPSNSHTDSDTYANAGPDSECSGSNTFLKVIYF